MWRFLTTGHGIVARGSCLCVLTCFLTVYTHGVGIADTLECYIFTYKDVFGGNKAADQCTLCDPPISIWKATDSPPTVGHHLRESLLTWKLADVQLLSSTLPLDPETRNFVRRNVQGALFSEVNPAPLKTHVQLAGVSKGALNEVLDLHERVAETHEFLNIVSGGQIFDGVLPLAHRYGGHQFGVWAGQLGDGRAHMLGEYVNDRGEKWELQLKGSGMTPYSRDGDGRAVIRSSVREFLCSEAMYHLGVPTSRAATLVISDDVVRRDQFYDGRPRGERTAVVLRLAQSWFRFGSFEILAQNHEIDLLKQLADFVIDNHFGHIDSFDPGKYLAFLSDVVEHTARLIAKWQGLGFAHGVCNTDNFSILSITIDYGPFAFMDEYNPEMVPNTSDDEGRYSFEKQPDVGYYNVEKLAQALMPLLNGAQQGQVGYILKGYVEHYKTAFMDIYRKKMGLRNSDRRDEYLVASLLKMMADQRADFTMVFRQLGDWKLGKIAAGKVDTELWALVTLSTHAKFNSWCALYHERLLQSDLHEQGRREMMHSVNPRYILRNWIAQEIIEEVEQDEFSKLRTTLQILKDPFEEQEEAELLGYADPAPGWAKTVKVSCSS